MDATFLLNPAFWRDDSIWCPGAPPDFIEVLDEAPELDGHIFFETSGSTGVPKRIALSKQALLLSAAAVNRHLQVTEDSCWGLALPVHHVGGFGIIARVFEASCYLAQIHGKWDRQEFFEWVAEDEVTHLSLVPTQVHDIVKAGVRAPSTLRAIVVGGGRLELELGQAARDLGWPVLASFGMTETGSQIATQSLEQLAMPYQTGDLSVLPIWRTRTTEDDLLEVSGPALFSGTVTRRGAAWHYEARRTEWHRTTDRVELRDGMLSPLGRNDLLVKVLGELVDPLVIEAELRACGAASLAANDFAVAAVPDERAEHALVPVFAASVSREQALQWVNAYNAQAPGFRRLKDPVLLASMPLSELGKIRRAELARMLQNF